MKWLRDRYHLALARLAALFYGNPSRALTVVGVTGTKGKSTTVELLSAIFDAAGERTAFLSSVRMKVGERTETNRTGNSMPGRGRLQRFLREAAREKCRYAFVEATSQGIIQHRHRFIEWDAAIFTNLAPEHIEAHGSFEAYRDAKLELFRALAASPKREKIAVVNADDPSAHRFIEASRGPGVRVVEISAAVRGAELQLSGAWISVPVNLENAALAAAYAEACEMPRHVIRRALDTFPGVPGRLEYVQEKPFAVVVDYAHTPDSLARIYKFLKAEHQGRLIGVFGSDGGSRDHWKRPALGAIAAHYCDCIVLTSENPYGDNPNVIMAAIETGIRESSTRFRLTENYWKIPDRREALRKAISLARLGDVVVATGKGSEPFIHLAKGKRIPWNERAELEKLLHA